MARKRNTKHRLCDWCRKNPVQFEDEDMCSWCREALNREANLEMGIDPILADRDDWGCK